jgi:hypothetical protein
MIIAEMRPADVPVEVLGLEIERKAVRQDRVHGLGNLAHRLVGQVGRGVQRLVGLAASIEGSDFAHGSPLTVV